MAKIPMLSNIELNVIAGFFPRPHQCLLQYITRNISYPAPEVFNCLKDLGQRGIVQWLWLRRASVYSLNIDSDEALEGYLFHVKLRKHKFEQRHATISCLAYQTAEKSDGDVVLLCEKTSDVIIEADDNIVLVEIVEIDKIIERDKNIDERLNNEDKTKEGTIKVIRISKTELKDMKMSDPNTLKYLLNTCFPIKSAKYFFELVYHEIGV